METFFTKGKYGGNGVHRSQITIQELEAELINYTNIVTDNRLRLYCAPLGMTIENQPTDGDSIQKLVYESQLNRQ